MDRNGNRTFTMPEETLERVDALLDDGEEREDFVRRAVERELARRERENQILSFLG